MEDINFLKQLYNNLSTVYTRGQDSDTLVDCRRALYDYIMFKQEQLQQPQQVETQPKEE